MVLACGSVEPEPTAITTGTGGASGAAGAPGSSGTAGLSGASGQQDEDPVTAACRAFFHDLDVRANRCGAEKTAAVEEAWVASCVTVAALPGVHVTAADIDACRAQSTGYCGAPLGCVSYLGGSPVPFPVPPFVGTLSTGAPCTVWLQCGSNTCITTAKGECGFCQELNQTGETCSPPSVVCQGGTCVEGTCVSDYEPPPYKQVGDACTLSKGDPDEGCDPSLFCLYTPGEDVGSCQPLVKLGDACTQENSCKSGLFCKRTTLGEPGACASPQDAAAEGEPCVSAPVACQPGLHCVTGDHYPDGVCRVPRVIGESCDKAAPCQGELACVHGVCAARLGEGKSCDVDEACASGSCREGICQTQTNSAQLGQSCSFQSCVAGLRCGATKVCEPLEVVGLDEECQGKACAAGLACSYFPVNGARRCLLPPPAGQPCIDYMMCEASAACDSWQGLEDPGTCVPRHGVGEACPCLDGLVCDGDRCASPGALDQPCPCIAPLMCVQGVCRPLGSPACP